MANVEGKDETQDMSRVPGSRPLRECGCECVKREQCQKKNEFGGSVFAEGG
jgi:hypothetical protein